jgi:hypothetical protein
LAEKIFMVQELLFDFEAHGIAGAVCALMQ